MIMGYIESPPPVVLPWCGIYRVKNLENGKYYIGQTRRSFHERWKEEIREAPYKRKYGYSLNKFEDILCTMVDDTSNKYIEISDTEAKFGHLHFKKLQEWHNMFTKKDLNIHESRAIDFFDSHLNGYNGNWGPYPCLRATLISCGGPNRLDLPPSPASLAGPLKLGEKPENLARYREAELMHARWRASIGSRAESARRRLASRSTAHAR